MEDNLDLRGEVLALALLDEGTDVPDDTRLLAFILLKLIQG